MGRFGRVLVDRRFVDPLAEEVDTGSAAGEFAGEIQPISVTEDSMKPGNHDGKALGETFHRWVREAVGPGTDKRFGRGRTASVTTAANAGEPELGKVTMQGGVAPREEP